MTDETASVDRQAWVTPQSLYLGLHEEFAFELDAAASAENAKCERYYTIQDNALAKPWATSTWVNPPFQDIRPWVSWAKTQAAQGKGSVLLLKAATATAWFHDFVRDDADWWYFTRRVAFEAPKGVEASSPPIEAMLARFAPRTLGRGRFAGFRKPDTGGIIWQPG